MIYFGTDGIRGVVGEDLTQEICFRCGNAVSKLKPKAKIMPVKGSLPSVTYKPMTEPRLIKTSPITKNNIADFTLLALICCHISIP